MIHVSIIVLHFNNEDDTSACLASLQKLTTPQNSHLDIIVVDNGSERVYALPDKNEPYKTTLIRNSENKGFTGGMNTGIQHAIEKKADWILILNNDTIVQADLVDELLSVAKERKGSGIIAPKIYFAKGHEFHKDRYRKEELGKVLWYAGGTMDWNNITGHHRGVDEVDHGQYDVISETDFASGCCMLLSTEMIEEIGMFDEAYFLYYEDNDLCIRAKKMKYGIYFSPKAVLHHVNAASSGGSGSTLQDYFITRNRLLFGMRYAPLRGKIALVKESLRFLIGGRKMQRLGVFDFYRRNFGKGSLFS